MLVFLVKKLELTVRVMPGTTGIGSPLNLHMSSGNLLRQTIGPCDSRAQRSVLATVSEFITRICLLHVHVCNKQSSPCCILLYINFIIKVHCGTVIQNSTK